MKRPNKRDKIFQRTGNIKSINYEKYAFFLDMYLDYVEELKKQKEYEMHKTRN
jgi:hypothetical protein